MLTQQLKIITLILVVICLSFFAAHHVKYASLSTNIVMQSLSAPLVAENARGTLRMLGVPLSNISVTSATAAATAAAPLFVHQSWKIKDLPPRFIRWFATWEVCFPGYEHRLWTDEDNLNLVRAKAPDFLDLYIQFKDKIQRADSVRYLYLHHYGGIYSDLDNECLRSFQHLIDSSGCGVILGSMRSNRQAQQYIQNSFMYSRPGHPFWLRVMEAIKERKDMTGANFQDTVDLTTGPKLLMHAVSQHKKTFEGTASPGPICVFPDTYFNPYSWDLDKGGPCKDLNKMTETDLANCKMKHKQAYVIQYHTQSWFAGKV